MKLHKDGTVEGTPQEIAEYNRQVSGTQMLRPVGEHHDSQGDPALKAVEEEIGEIKYGQARANLRHYYTKHLSEELEQRTGVEVYKIAPHDEYSLIIGRVRHDRTGPATILINQD